MIRGTFANIRLRNLLAPGTEGGGTRHLPGRRTDDDLRRRHEIPGRRRAADRARRQGIRLRSSRDWAAKGTLLLGVRAVIAESLRAHPSQQPVGMGVLPLSSRRRESREPRPQRRGDLRDPRHRHRSRAAQGADGRRRSEPAGRRRSSRRLSASTRRSSSTTTGTAGSYLSCSASCSKSSRFGRSAGIVGECRCRQGFGEPWFVAGDCDEERRASAAHPRCPSVSRLRAP